MSSTHHTLGYSSVKERGPNTEQLLDSRQPLRPGEGQKAKPQCGFPSAKTRQDSFSMRFRFFPE